jgi:hypothetical protein
VADRTLTAIGTLASKLIPNSEGEQKEIYAARMLQYAGRAYASIVPSALVEEADDIDLSTNPEIARLQIYEAAGVPAVDNGKGALIAPPREAILKAVTPDQNRLLGLLGLWGPPGNMAGADYSLFERYFENDAPDHWQPKAEFGNTGVWQAYLAGEG